MSTPYVPIKYITLQDALEHIGFTVVQINAISKVEKDRYQNWVREANNAIELVLFRVGNDSPLLPNSREFAYAKQGALDWVIYKKRDKEGSKNAANSFTDFEHCMKELEVYLIATRTIRTETASILGKSPKDQEILLPSQIDTQFY